MWGVQYNEFLGQLHFTIFFVGVNVTFFPMHYLGLAGMPRRIPDYNPAYILWNQISSLGAMMSVIATLIFGALLFDALRSNRWSRENVYTYPPFAYRNAGKVIIDSDIVQARGLSTALPVRRNLELSAPSTSLMFGHVYNRTIKEIDLAAKHIKIAASLPLMAIIVGDDTVMGRSLPSQLGFQLPGNAGMEGLVDLHNDIMLVVAFIAVYVLYLLGVIIWKFNESSTYASRDVRSFTYSLALEFI